MRTSNVIILDNRYKNCYWLTVGVNDTCCEDWKQITFVAKTSVWPLRRHAAPPAHPWPEVPVGPLQAAPWDACIDALLARDPESHTDTQPYSSQRWAPMCCNPCPASSGSSNCSIVVCLLLEIFDLVSWVLSLLCCVPSVRGSEIWWSKSHWESF
jgi:hypothetical protein